MAVDSSVKIYSYDQILFATSGLLGERSISIIPKATPQGVSPAENITSQVLVAQSNDKLDRTLNQLSSVANTLQTSMEDFSHFIKSNDRDFNLALKSFARASSHIEKFMERACSIDVTEKIAAASDRLTLAAARAELFFTTAQETHLVERMGDSFEKSWVTNRPDGQWEWKCLSLNQ